MHRSGSILAPLNRVSDSAFPPHTGSSRKKIAFFKQGVFSYTNVRTAEQLRACFPGYEVEEFDVLGDLVHRHPFVRALSIAHTIRLYGRRLLWQGLPLAQASFRTPYLFHRLHEMICEKFTPRAHEFAFTFQTQSLFDASLPGVPHFVYTDHTHLANAQYPGFPADELFPQSWVNLEREIYQNARHIFVMSDHVRTSLHEDYGVESAHTSTVHAGSNIDTTPAPLENDGFRNRTIVFIGLEWERKGGPTLLTAFTRLRAEMPDVRLIILGCQPAGLPPGCEAHGRVSREEVKRWLSRASLLCLPTRVEPFGIAVVEAFAHRLPVVASNIGAMPGIVQQGVSGLLVPPDDPAALAAALRELLNDPEKCRRFGEAGHAHVREHYTWEAVGAKIRAGIEAALHTPAGA